MTSEEFIKVKIDSALVQTQLTILQNIIQRMASNSANCKTWCVTLVSAILVLVVDKNRTQFAWVSILPIIAFAILDVYYLTLEKAFRDFYNKFVKKLHDGKLVASDFDISIDREGSCCWRCQSINSFSIFGFYVMLAILVAITNMIAIG